ncbi:MAG: TIGR00341 family protein [Gammaproteobacteria bacterium]|nr:TIGR00341 family protein [Gammaproteobacteria bacterium]
MRIIEILTDKGHADTLHSIAEQHEILDCWTVATEDENRLSTRMLVRPEKQQTILDAVQTVLGNADNSRIIIQPVEATLPRPAEAEKKETGSSPGRAREELYQQIVSGAKLDSNFILLVIFSTIVATIGLIENNIAVVIGAMVIAPLLGPNIALAFAAALGDSKLIWSSLKTNLIGLGVALLLSILLGLIWPMTHTSEEILARTDVGFDGIALALVSGAAAVLSLTTGLSSALVGVMVAVALLPPTATLGLMIATGQHQYALGALLLLAVNVVCVNLAAKLVFLLKGVKPRTWLEKQKARQSMTAYIVFWLITLLVLSITIVIRAGILS